MFFVLAYTYANLGDVPFNEANDNIHVRLLKRFFENVSSDDFQISSQNFYHTKKLHAQIRTKYLSNSFVFRDHLTTFTKSPTRLKKMT